MLEQRKFVTAEPENSETPLDAMRSWVTPTRLFFVRNHFGIPEVDLARWRLVIDGCLERPRDWTWDELAELPQRSVFATVECAGNGRSFLEPHAYGVQWGAGAVGHAEWTGVPLKLLLEQAGLKPDAVEIVFEGADRGSEADHPEPMNFQRGLPIDKATNPDTLLVMRMNGELLEPNHGFPLRLFVPGWYGVASVKWLTRITAVSEPFRGYFQTKKYTRQRRSAAGVETEIIGRMAVKSEIIRPRADEVLGVGTNRIFGIAWAGDEAIAAVQVSTDRGATWTAAELMGPRAAYSWTMWEYLWEVATPAAYSLMARAISASGRMQPIDHNPLNGGYMIHHSRPTDVRIESSRRSIAARADADALLYDMNAFAESNAALPLDADLEFAIGGGI